MKILLDSNIIVYSLNNSSPKHKVAQEFIQDNHRNLVLSHQNILESIRVLTHPKFSLPMKPNDANEAVWAIAGALQLISPNLETLFLAKEFIDKYNLKSDEIFDAYLVATALSNGISFVATDNTRHFKVFKEIRVLNPFVVK